MDFHTAFHHMVLNMATLLISHRGSPHEGLGYSVPSQVLEIALWVTADRLRAGIAENDGELASTAQEFVDWQLSTYSAWQRGRKPAPNWCKGLYREAGHDLDEDPPKEAT